MGESSTAEGTRLGAYRIEKLLGEGAMGEVYVAVHEALGRHVAIKKLKPHVAADQTMTERFFAEARAVNIIRHENIVECTDMVSEGGTSYIVMELLEGKTLSSAIRAVNQIPPVRAVKIAAQIADALAAAHSKGIVHRDLKPDNVFLIKRAGTSDYVKVLDFGMARLRPDLGGVQSTQSGALIGTPAYMSPEQARGEKVGPSADIYALGVVVFHMLTGQLPFAAASLTMMLIAIVQETPPSVDKLAKDVPKPLVDLVRRCLDKDVAKRPADMATLRKELLESVGLPVEVVQSMVGEKSPYASGDNKSFGMQATLDSGQRAPVDVLGETSAPGTSASPAVAQTTAPAWAGQSSITSAAAEVSTAKPKPKPWLLIGGGIGAVAIAAVVGIVVMSKGAHESSPPAAAPPAPTPAVAAPTAPAPTPPPPPAPAKTDVEKARDELAAAMTALDEVSAKYSATHPDVIKAQQRADAAKAALDKLVPHDPLNDWDGSATAPTKKPVATKKPTTAKPTTKTTAKTGAGSAAPATPPVETKPPPDDKVDRTKQLVGPRPPPG